MTKHPDLFAALAAPFDPSEIRTRSQGGRTLSYITARVAMNRLDSVLGPENWWDRFVPGENSVLCELTIRLPDGSTLTKCDAGGYAGMADQGDDDKSGYSDAFKRACVKHGVGRYLYRDGVPTFVQERVTGTNEQLSAQPEAPAQGRRPETGAPPEPRKERDKWGHPATTPPAAAAANGHGGPASGNGQGRGGSPRSGKALFAWCKEQEQQHHVGLIKYLNGFAKLQEWPGRMVDFDAEQVQLAYAEAVRKLQTLQDAGSEAYEDALSN